jgi:hypothetical protein
MDLGLPMREQFASTLIGERRDVEPAWFSAASSAER